MKSYTVTGATIFCNTDSGWSWHNILSKRNCKNLYFGLTDVIVPICMPHPFLDSSRIPAVVSDNLEATEAGTVLGWKSGDKH